MQNKIFSNCLFRVFLLLIWFLGGVLGHGRLVDPPARGTMWRLGFNTPPNYNDHELHCGGYAHQWEKNKGRCGECGDPHDQPRPRPNENGGTFGTGIISRAYRQEEETTITVHLTANHLGWFEFRLCENNKAKQYVKQSCLNKNVLKLVDYPGTRYEVTEPNQGLFRIRVKLPKGVICTNCVVQWHYTSGNNWGDCPKAANKVGCGPQEVFRGCSDVAIFPPDDDSYFKFQNLTRVMDYNNMDDKTGHYKTEEETKKEKEKQKKKKEHNENEIDSTEDKKRSRGRNRQPSTTSRSKVYSYFNRYEKDDSGNYVSSSSFRDKEKNKKNSEKIREFLKSLPSTDSKSKTLQHLINKPRPQNMESYESRESEEVVSGSTTLEKLSNIMTLLLKLTASTSSQSEAIDLLDKVGKSLTLAVKRKDMGRSSKAKESIHPIQNRRLYSRTNSLRKERKEYYSSQNIFKRKMRTTTKPPTTRAPKRVPIYVTPKTFVELLSRRNQSSSSPPKLDKFRRKQQEKQSNNRSSENVDQSEKKYSLDEIKQILEISARRRALERLKLSRRRSEEISGFSDEDDSLLSFVNSKSSLRPRLDDHSSEEKHSTTDILYLLG